MKRWLPRVAGRAHDNPRIQPSKRRRKTLRRLVLEDHFDGELNLTRRRCSSGQHTRPGRWKSRPVEKIRIDRRRGRRKIGMIENVEDFSTELHVESLRNPLDIVILKQGEVQFGQARADQAIATSITAQVKARVCGEPA